MTVKCVVGCVAEITPPKSMTNQEIINEIKEDHDDSGEWDCSYSYDDSDYLEEVEAEEWTQHCKNQYRQVIYWSPRHNVHIAVNESRSGSYHTDWYYGIAEVDIVEKVTRVVTKEVTEWVTV